MKIYQFMPDILLGDAVGGQAYSVDEVLREMGHETCIYAQRRDLPFDGRVKHWKDYESDADKSHILLYHYSIGSEMTAWFAALPGKKAIMYHNVTPSHFFVGFDYRAYYTTKKGRIELGMLRDKVFLTLAAGTEYNKLELEGLGFGNVVTCPYIVDFAKWEPAKQAAIEAEKLRPRESDGKVDILYVGRMSPNKCVEDIVKTYYFYKRHVNADSTLTLVGPVNESGLYERNLMELVKYLDLEDVRFTGKVTDKTKLAGYYRRAGVYLSMSEHEGFGIPLIEAMNFGVPVLAYRATGVPFTMGSGGVVFNEKDYRKVAELIHLVSTDSGLRGKVLASQEKRLLDFTRDKVYAGIKEGIGKLAASAGEA